MNIITNLFKHLSYLRITSLFLIVTSSMAIAQIDHKSSSNLSENVEFRVLNYTPKIPPHKS